MVNKKIKIKFIKKFNDIKEGEIFDCSKKDADAWVKEGVAEYVELIKKSKKSVEKVSVTSNTDNTGNTGNTGNTDKLKRLPVLSVLCITDLSKVVFGENIFEQILKILATSKEYFTYDKIANVVDKKPDNIRQAINRKKEYFISYLIDGRKRVIQLSQIAKDEINQRIDNLKALEEQKKKAEDELKLEKLKGESFTQEIKNFLHDDKLKREGVFLILDFEKVLEYSHELADLFLEEPDRFLNEIIQHYGLKLNIKVINIPEIYSINIEDIREHNLDKLISVEGRVTSLGEVKPVISETTYLCNSCGTLIYIKQNYRKGILEAPKRCSCGKRGGFISNSNKKLNACFVQLEDLQDKTDNPHSQRIKSVLFNYLCDAKIIKMFTPGNEVKCLGILKEVPTYKGNRETIFPNWIFEIIDVELIEKEIDIENFSDEEIKDINELSVKVDIKGIEFLYDSFAPDVFGYGEIKGAMILQLCNKKNKPKKNAVRNKSNILMIGDPGIAKSVLGDFALSVSTGSRKAVGGGSSAVGITASVVKEEDSLGGYRVEPGAMILAKDLLFIDELNNLQDEDKPKLQEGMNEQRVSINKANLHVQMKVTCGMIAAANPIHGHFKEGDKLSIQEQFNIPSPILNRFDSTFVMRDQISEDGDRLIAKRMIKRQRGILKPKYNVELLKKFFAYIRYSEEPIIDDETQKLFEEIYSLARKIYNPGVKINPRFLESLTRMSIASAKIRQSKKVELKDIETSIKILSKSQYNIDETIILKLKNE